MSEDCLLGEDCIGIRSCTAVVQQLQRAKATQDATKRNEIIQSVRDKVVLNFLQIYPTSKKTSGLREEKRAKGVLCFF